MLDLDKLANFLEKNNLKLDSTNDDLLLIKLDLNLLIKLVDFLKKNNAMFETLVVSKNTNINLKYFFYVGIKGKLLLLDLEVEMDDEIPSLTGLYQAVFSYEKESSLRFKIKFSDCNPVKVAPHYPPELTRDIEEGETTIIPVGPIHAGIIEPGHFHFTTLGEHIINLEISLGYKYKNIEHEFENRSVAEGLELAQHICGDSTFAYGLAFTQAIEKIYKLEPSPSVQYMRTIVLEMERLYNHCGDLGGLVNDTGFSVVNSYLSALKEKVLGLNKIYFGHRYLRNFIKINAVTRFLTADERLALGAALQVIKKDFLKVIGLTLKHNTVLERFSNTGCLTNHNATLCSVSGLVGRASGVSYDSRRDLPYAAYEELGFHSHLRREGDVLARFNLRVSEVDESLNIIHHCLAKLDVSGQGNETEIDFSKLSVSRPFAWSVAEAARGPVLVYLALTNDGKITRAKIRDVSVHNWKALEYAVLNNIVPDFPLCNKSFSMAYAGADM